MSKILDQIPKGQLVQFAAEVATEIMMTQEADGKYGAYGHDGGILQNEPRYKLEQLVTEIAGRRDAVLVDMTDEFRALILGLVDQFAAMKRHDPDIDVKTIKFEQIRWMNDGTLVINVTHNKRPFVPRNVSWS